MSGCTGAHCRLGIGIVLFTSSCSNHDAGELHAASSASSSPIRRAERPEASSVDAAALPRLFTGHETAREEWESENLRRLDPTVDGWSSEVAAQRVSAQLDVLLPALWNGGEGWSSFLAPQFEGATALRPATRDVLFDDGCTRVERASAPSRELLPAEQLARSISELRAPFAGERARLGFDLVAIDLVGEHEFEADVLVRAAAAPNGAPVQQGAHWHVAWTAANDAEAPRVRSLRVTSFEETRACKPYFADHTARVFADNPGFDREYRLGIGDHYFKNDQLTGNAFLGGQGVAVGDVDGDGLEDVYVSMQGGIPKRLFLHRADGRAVAASSEAKVAFLDLSRSALVLDLDDDGDEDLAVALVSNVVIAFNDGRGAFDDQQLLRSPTTEEIFSLAAADADGDGDVDIYCCRYSQDAMIGAVPTPYCDAHNGAPDVFWRNEGGGRFVDATLEAGFGASNDRYGLAAVWEDFDDDGDADLYVANDFGRNNLFRNEGGHFRDVASDVGADDMAASMGATTADFDLDGDFDLYVSNMFSAPGLRTTRIGERFMGGEHRELHAAYARHARGNTLLRNRGDGSFDDVSESFDATRGGWAWGARFVDLDNDGYEDLCVPSGFVTNASDVDVASFFWRRVISQSPPQAPTPENYRQAWASIQRMTMNRGYSWAGNERNVAYLNLGGRSFADVSACSGLDFQSDGRALSVVDWDDDGRLDLLLKSRSAPRLRFLRNQVPQRGHWISFDLAGAKRNRDAIGARVVVELPGRTLRRTLHAGDGYLAQSSKRLHFGLGDALLAERVTVRWPDGSTQSFEKLAADTRYRIVQGVSAATLVEPRTVGAFEREPPSPVEPLPEGVRRIPLVERVPVQALPLPRFDGTPRKIADLRGELVLLTLWTSDSTASLDQIAELGRRAGELADLGVRPVTLTIDEGRALLTARHVLALHGLERDAGYADAHLRKLLEVLAIAVFGRSTDLPLPTSLLVDARGEWVVAYPGPLDFAALRSDVELVKQLGDRRKTDRLFGGRWVSRPQRDLGTAAEVFRVIGASEMAACLTSARASDDEK